MGFSLRLDAVSRYSNRHDRGGCGRFRALHRGADPVVFRVELLDRANPLRWVVERVCHVTFDCAVPRPGDDRAAHVYEHARPEARQTGAEHFHDGENRSAHRAHFARHHRWFAVGRRCGELQRLLEFARRFTGGWPGTYRGDGLRSFCWHLRSPNQFALLGRRLEQYHVYRWRSERSAAEHSALTCVWHVSGDRNLSACQRRVSGGAPIRGNPERSE